MSRPHSNSVRSYHLGGDQPTLKQALQRQLPAGSLAHLETSHDAANEAGDPQYSARLHFLRADGWIIENRTERVDGRVRGWFRIYFDAMRARGPHDLLAVAFPHEYSNGIPRVQAPLAPNNGTLPLFTPTPVRYADPEEVA